MISSRYMCAAIMAAIVSPTVAHADQPRYLSTREILLDCQPANDVEVTQTELWVSTDAGRTWQAMERVRVDGSVLRFAASQDGGHDFYVVLKNPAGVSAQPPKPGSRPVASVVVDTIAPLLQLHGAVAEVAADGQLLVSMDMTLVEENLSEGSLRVFYRADSDEWLDGGAVDKTDDGVIWLAPGLSGAFVDLRLVATDRAGNRCSAEMLDVALPPTLLDDAPYDAGEPGLEPEQAHEPLSQGVRPVGPPRVVPVQPPVVDPTTAGGAEPGFTGPPPAADVAHLRQLAARFMSEGRYSLAAARFEDALSVSPRDADLLVDLGSALYRVGRHDEAGERFETALGALPDHIGAIEGLALVAATQKRYPQARQHMLHLRRLRPDSGSVWLRSGDIEHRLGNGAAALEAWRRVLDVPDADDELRAKAQRRLDYFDSARTGEPAPKGSPAATDSKWHRPTHEPRSSSSTETNPTEKTSS